MILLDTVSLAKDSIEKPCFVSSSLIAAPISCFTWFKTGLLTYLKLVVVSPMIRICWVLFAPQTNTRPTCVKLQSC